jgi:hypothetical protein
MRLHAMSSPGELLKHLDGRPALIHYLRMACYLFCSLILLSNVWTIAGWNESRGVYDDICYLRQAHLFQRFGVGGLDTDIARDDDRYLSSKLKEIGFSDWNVPARAPCHSLIEATQKRVMTPPPGTGFSLALFPAGFQVIPLYLLANFTIFGFAIFGVSRARGLALLTLAAFFGDTAIYLMINPTKASYSMAPTMMMCALAGYLTARLFSDETRPRLLLTVLTGFVVGTLTITDEAVVALSGEEVHLVLRPGGPGDRIAGVALHVTDAELFAADEYETDDYRRVIVTLESGREAFVYVAADA